MSSPKRSHESGSRYRSARSRSRSRGRSPSPASGGDSRRATRHSDRERERERDRDAAVATSSSRESAASQNAVQTYRLRVSGFSGETPRDEIIDQLKSLFSDFPIRDITTAKMRHASFAYVIFASEEDMKAAYQFYRANEDRFGRLCVELVDPPSEAAVEQRAPAPAGRDGATLAYYRQRERDPEAFRAVRGADGSPGAAPNVRYAPIDQPDRAAVYAYHAERGYPRERETEAEYYPRERERERFAAPTADYYRDRRYERESERIRPAYCTEESGEERDRRAPYVDERERAASRRVFVDYRERARERDAFGELELADPNGEARDERERRLFETDRSRGYYGPPRPYEREREYDPEQRDRDAPAWRAERDRYGYEPARYPPWDARDRFGPPGPPGPERLDRERPGANAGANALGEPNRTLFVGNLPYDIDEADCRTEFGAFGRIEEIDIKRKLESGNAPNGSPTAYAFIKFYSLLDAERARNQLSGRAIRLSATPSGKPESAGAESDSKVTYSAPLRIGYGHARPTRCLWVGLTNVSPTQRAAINKSELMRTFEKFGSITHSHFEEDTFSAGYGFVLFDVVDSARAAHVALNRKPLGRVLQQIVNFPPPRDRDRDPDGCVLRLDFVEPTHMPSYDAQTMAPRTPGMATNNVETNIVPSAAGMNPNYKGGRYIPAYSHTFHSRHTTEPHLPFDGPPLSHANAAAFQHMPPFSAARCFYPPPYMTGSPGGPPPVPFGCPPWPAVPLPLSGMDEQMRDETMEESDTERCIAELASRIKPSWNHRVLLKRNHFLVNAHLLGGDEQLAERAFSLSGLRTRVEDSVLRISDRLKLSENVVRVLEERLQFALAPQNSQRDGVAFFLLIDADNDEDGDVDSRKSESECDSTLRRSLRALVAYMRLKKAAAIVRVRSDAASPLGSTEAAVGQQKCGSDTENYSAQTAPTANEERDASRRNSAASNGMERLDALAPENGGSYTSWYLFPPSLFVVRCIERMLMFRGTATPQILNRLFAAAENDDHYLLGVLARS